MNKAEIQKRWRERNKESIRLYQQEHYRRNRTVIYERVQNARNLREFGLTQAEIESTYKQQGGCCACCGEEISLVRGRKNIRRIDHDHTKQKGDPGFFRGLLCNHCNTGLGLFGDNPAKLQLGIDYLRRRRFLGYEGVA
jgi:hypothetical protein